ncbi:MAG: metal-sulfur cluster assembly factor [Candidatus Woesearchaeota archaeon]|jgi:metal-sulfur cluster biosynthetic enzyme
MTGIAEKIKNLFKKKENSKQPIISQELKPDLKEEKIVSRKISKEELEANPNNKEIITAIQKVMDPELGIDLWTLGLIYDIKKETDTVHIVMTFTSIMCPLGPQMIESIKQEVGKIKSLKTVTIEVTFEPMWEPTEDLRAMMGV